MTLRLVCFVPRTTFEEGLVLFPRLASRCLVEPSPHLSAAWIIHLWMSTRPGIISECLL